MPSNNKIWLYLFAILSLLNLSAEFVDNKWLIYATKPLLMIVLSVYFYLETKPTSRYVRYILWGFIFSFFGDTFLMFVENEAGKEHFFLLGLGSFLLTHLFYLLAFWSVKGAKKGGHIVKNKWLILLFLGYVVGNIAFLWPDIAPDLRIPVVVYSTMIVAMAMACLNLKGVLSPTIFRILLIGGLLFVLSDSIIALNKFKAQQFPLVYPRLMIMIPYLLSQYLIAKGSIWVSKIEYSFEEKK